MAQEDPDKLADELGRDADRLQEGADELGRQVDQTRQDWERKRRDEGVPGAPPPSEEEAGEGGGPSPRQDEDGDPGPAAST